MIGLQDVDVVLRDGSTVRVRAGVPSDRPALERFLSGLSEESRIFRFFTAVKDLAWVADRFLQVDYRERHSLVALHREEIVGHGFYALQSPGRAEVALTVADALQGRGLGTILLGHLAAHAFAVGIDEFYAEVMPENHRMLGVFRASGFALRSRSSYGVVTLEFPTSLTAQARDRFERREQLAAVAALARFFEPRSIAVVGASRHRGTIGGEVFHNLLDCGFPGPVYPISRHPVVQSVTAHSDVRSVPNPVDLAIVVVPAPDVVPIARACAEKEVCALIVLSAGFAEAGEEGRQRQSELLEVCRHAGMRLIGPNCMGICSTVDGQVLNATFAPNPPLSGRVGFMSQSGALAVAVIEHARRLGLGFSHLVSVGNKADISGNDLLEFWDDDPHTDVVVLYLESFGNGRRFSRLARRVGRRKPVLVVKSARTPPGARASTSHTGALLAASDVTVEGLFQQSGVIRADALGELFDVARLLASQPPPGGIRVGIVSNVGGLGILCADGCVAGGLEVPALTTGTRAALADVLGRSSGSDNPVDVSDAADPAAYEAAIRTLGQSGEVDALIVLFVPPLAAVAGDVAAAVDRAAAALDRRVPVLGVFSASEPAPASGGSVPRFQYPEEAARALAKVAGWSVWRSRPEEAPWEAPDKRRDEAQALIASALGRGEVWLSPEGSAGVLGCYGVRMVETRAASSPTAAGRAAEGMRRPVALKAFGPGLTGRRSLGAVALDLRSGRAVQRAAREMRDRLTGAGYAVSGFTIQPMVNDADQLIVGVTQDPVFGPVLACGHGEASEPVVRLTPLSETEAEDVVLRLGGSPALRELVLRVGALVEDLPEVVELDLEPVLVNEEGAFVGDASLRVEVRAPQPPLEARVRRH